MHDKVEKCPHCGASMKMFWHRLNAGMISALVKFKRSIIEKERNSLHLYRDLVVENKLTTQEQMNWTKLRFHGLVAKCKEDGERKRGYWLLTHRGNEFLAGRIQIPRKVQTFRNKITAYDDLYVTIGDVIKEVPYWDSAEDFRYDFADITDVTDHNNKPVPFTFGKDGQGKLIV